MPIKSHQDSITKTNNINFMKKETQLNHSVKKPTKK